MKIQHILLWNQLIEILDQTYFITKMDNTNKKYWKDFVIFLQDFVENPNIV